MEFDPNEDEGRNQILALLRTQQMLNTMREQQQQQQQHLRTKSTKPPSTSTAAPAAIVKEAEKDPKEDPPDSKADQAVRNAVELKEGGDDSVTVDDGTTTDNTATTSNVAGAVVVASSSSQLTGTAPGGGVRTRPPRTRTPRVRSIGYVAAKDSRTDFFAVWTRKLDLFVHDASKTTLELPNELTANDRREIHGLADKYNLSHLSTGTGFHRKLILKKDALFFKLAGQLRPVDVESLVNGTAEVGPNAKQSKFHLRKTSSSSSAQDGDGTPMYADESVLKAVRRLEKATDHYRDAVEVGMTTEQLQSQNTVERMLESTPSGFGMSTSSAGHTGSSSFRLGAAASSAVPPAVPQLLGPQSVQLPLNVGPASYEEECLACGGRSVVDYDIKEWDCNGQCVHCGKDSIFRLHTIYAPNPSNSNNNNKHQITSSSVAVEEIEKEPIELQTQQQQKRPREDDDSLDSERNRHRNPPQQRHQQEVEEIEKEEDEEEEIELTVSDVVDLATVNDMSQESIDRVTDMATALHTAGLPIERYLHFALDFADMAKPHTAIARALRSLQQQQQPQNDSSKQLWFLKVTEVEVPGVTSVSTLRLLDDALKCLFALPEGEEEDQGVTALLGRSQCVVVLPGTSVFGAKWSAVVAVAGVPNSNSAPAALKQLQEKFGSKHVKWGTNVEDVL